MQLADQAVWVAVVSESDSAPPWLNFRSGEDADPPMARFASRELGGMVHFLSFFATSGPVAPRIVASTHKDAGNTEDHDADENLSW